MMTDWIILGLRMMALLLLMLFLAISIYHLKIQTLAIIPKDYLQQISPPQLKFDLEATTSFGRHPDNTYTFANSFISAHHATIVYQQTRWWLTDLDSTNGTSVNEMPVQASTPLSYGDIITFGDLQLQLQPEDPSR